jgi:hypothetical protein
MITGDEQGRPSELIIGFLLFLQLPAVKETPEMSGGNSGDELSRHGR